MASNSEVAAANPGGPARVPSPPPSRSVEPVLDRPADIDPNGLTPGTPRVPSAPVMRTSAPPSNPEEAASSAEYKKRLGEALQAIGTVKEEFNAALLEQQLKFDMTMAALAGQKAPAAPNLPANVDPNSQPTWAEVAQVMAAIPNVVAAQAIQATWDVTQDEINLVFQANPALQSVAEPQRTQLVQRAAKLLRSKARQSTVAPATSQAPGQRATPSPQTRTLNPMQVTPHVESASGAMPLIDDTASGNDEVAVAQREYREAERIKDPKERFRAKRAAWERALKAQGVSLEELGKTSFSVGG